VTAYALERLSGIPGVVLYGDADPEKASGRLGVIPFNVEGLPHALTAAVLSCEWGIGTRNGCFCSHPYVQAILRVPKSEAEAVQRSILARDRSRVPGIVRASIGLGNTVEDIDRLGEALDSISRGRFDAGYVLNAERGEYIHPRFLPDFSGRVHF
jgi:cysteine desulfurase / selenocysteine lyase